MKRRSMLKGLGAGTMLSAMAGLAGLSEISAQTGPSSTVVFELREYHANEGKLPDILTRFRDHGLTIFKRHGLVPVAFWTPTDPPLKGKTLFYILKHPSREAATANWDAFRADSEWQRVTVASEANGKLVESIDSTFLTLTDFSLKI